MSQRILGSEAAHLLIGLIDSVAMLLALIAPLFSATRSLLPFFSDTAFKSILVPETERIQHRVERGNSLVGYFEQ